MEPHVHPLSFPVPVPVPVPVHVVPPQSHWWNASTTLSLIELGGTRREPITSQLQLVAWLPITGDVWLNHVNVTGSVNDSVPRTVEARTRHDSRNMVETVEKRLSKRAEVVIEIFPKGMDKFPFNSFIPEKEYILHLRNNATSQIDMFSYL